MENDLVDPVEEFPFDIEMDSSDEKDVNEFNYEDHYWEDIEADESGSSERSGPKRKKTKLLNLQADRLPEKFVQEFSGPEEDYEECEHSYMKIKKRKPHVVESKEKPKIPSVIQLNMKNNRIVTKFDRNQYYKKASSKNKSFLKHYMKPRIVPVGYAPFKASKAQRKNVASYINQQIRTKQDRKLAKRLEFERKTERQKKQAEEEVEREQNIEDLRLKLLDLDKQKHDLFTNLKACLQQEQIYKQVLEEENRRIQIIEYFRNESSDSNQATSSSSLIQKDQCGKSHIEMVAQYNDLLGKIIEEKNGEVLRLEAQLQIDQARVEEMKKKCGTVRMTEEKLMRIVRKLKESECDDRDEKTIFDYIKNHVEIEEEPKPVDPNEEARRLETTKSLKNWHAQFLSGQMKEERKQLFIRSVLCRPLECITDEMLKYVPANIREYVLSRKVIEQTIVWIPNFFETGCKDAQKNVLDVIKYNDEFLGKELVNSMEREQTERLQASLQTILDSTSSQVEQIVDEDLTDVVPESHLLEENIEKETSSILCEEKDPPPKSKGFPYVLVKKEPEDSLDSFSRALGKGIPRATENSQLIEQQLQESILNQSDVSEPMILGEVLPIENQNVVDQFDVLQKIKQEVLEAELLNVEDDPSYVKPAETPNSSTLLDDELSIDDDEIFIEETQNIQQQNNSETTIVDQSIDVENSFVEEEPQPTTSQAACSLPTVSDPSRLLEQQRQQLIQHQLELQKHQQETFLLQELQKRQYLQQQELQNQMALLRAQEQLRAITQQQIPLPPPPPQQIMPIHPQIMPIPRPMYPMMPQYPVIPTEFINPYPSEIQYIGAYGPAFGINPVSFQPALFTARPLDREIKQEVITPPPYEQID